MRTNSLVIGLLLMMSNIAVEPARAWPVTPSKVINSDNGAAILLVTKTEDTNDGLCSSDCSLREAIARVTAGGTIIFSALFDSPQTITLTLGELAINKSLTITGPGARLLTISGNNTTRVFNITLSGTIASISGVTIANGQVTGTGGAGIRALGISTLNLTAVTLRNNHALGSSAVGGAIQTNGALNITRSTISNNSALQGAGINLQPGAGVCNISNSTISGNVASNFGGGLIGVSNVIFNNVTVTNNSATEGGGVFGGGFELRNSIVARNTGTTSHPNIAGTSVSRGNNLIGSNQGAEANFPAGNPNANGDRVGTAAAPIDPRLTPLQNLGGPTDLHVSLSNSLARNNGNNCVTNSTCPTSNPSTALTTDQRGPGFPRLFTNVDIGAYEANNCTFTLSSPSTIDIDSRANIVGFSIATQAGCAWNSVPTVPWLSILNGGGGTGSGSTAFTVQANTSATPRTGTVTAGDQVFTVNQAGLPTLSIVGSPHRSEGNSGLTNFDFPVTLSAASAQNVTVQYQSIGNGATAGTDFISVSGVLTFSPGQTTKIITVQVIGDTLIEPNENFAVFLSSPTNALLTHPGLGETFIINDDGLASAPFDFDDDGKTDVGIFRPGVGEWWINRSSNGSSYAAQFGTSTDKIAPADFTGDGKADFAFWRPASGEWFVLRSENFSYYSFPFGANGDIPKPADYDEDGKADAAVFRPSNATWYIRRSSDGGTTTQAFGASTDIPVPADYDGDGKVDIAIFRPSTGQWWLNRSTAGGMVLTFGVSSDKPVQGDYTGDGKSDVAFWRPSTGEWYVLRSNDLSYYVVPFGTTGDVPAPGDYDGDGKFDPTVFRPSSATWYSQRSTAGTLIQGFGASGDRPIANAFVP